jgi:hypothetical protein
VRTDNLTGKRWRQFGFAVSICKTLKRKAKRDRSADLRIIQVQQCRELAKFASYMADSHCAMVRRAMRVPLGDKVPSADRKPIPAVRIPNLQNRSWDGFTFCREKLDFPASFNY